MASLSLTTSVVVGRVVEVDCSSGQAWSRQKCGLGACGFRRQFLAPISGVSISRKPMFHIAASFGAETERAFKKTIEIDRLIDNLRETKFQNMAQVVAENVLAFNAPFWLRLAARADQCSSDEERMQIDIHLERKGLIDIDSWVEDFFQLGMKEYEELANQIMTLVDLIVNKTKEKIESSTDILRSILKPLVENDEDEIVWPPRNQASLVEMRKEVQRREEGNFLDEGFLSEVSAQLRQAKEDKDKPGLVAILQKVLQLYAASTLSKRRYAVKDGVVDKAESLLEQVLNADEGEWNDLLRSGLNYGGGAVTSEELFKAIERRIERTLMRTENGSYHQRVLAEYIREIEIRAEALVAAFKSSSPTS